MSAGFVDLVMVRGIRLLMVELKSQDGRPTAQQRHVFDLLRSACEVYLWRPIDLDEVIEVLR